MKCWHLLHWQNFKFDIVTHKRWQISDMINYRKVWLCPTLFFASNPEDIFRSLWTVAPKSRHFIAHESQLTLRVAIQQCRHVKWNLLAALFILSYTKRLLITNKNFMTLNLISLDSTFSPFIFNKAMTFRFARILSLQTQRYSIKMHQLPSFHIYGFNDNDLRCCWFL